jgi:hypothetical protein
MDVARHGQQRVFREWGCWEHNGHYITLFIAFAVWVGMHTMCQHEQYP